MDKSGNEMIYAVNFSPISREDYSIGVDGEVYEEVFNTDSLEFGGAGLTNGTLRAEKENYKGKKYKLTMKIPALSGVYLRKKSKDIRLD